MTSFRRPSSRLVATLGILGGSFLAAIEATIVATAMPTVVQQLGGLGHYSWVFSAYLLTSTVTVPLWGKLADLYGRRPFYAASIGVFLVGSALSGAAQTMPELIVFRAIQGLGAGGILPIGLTMLADMFTLEARARVQGLFSGMWGLASIAGPLVGGYIADALSWRWVFYLNVPFGIAAGALVWFAFVDREPHAHPRIDYPGAATLTAAVVLLMLALGQTDGRTPMLSPMLLGLYLGAAACFWLFVRIEQRAPEPVVPLDLFEDRLVSAVMLCGFLVGIAMFGAISYVPLFAQMTLGATATESGGALTPLLLGWVSAAVLSGRLTPSLGFRPQVLFGLGLISVGFLALTWLGPESSLWTLRGDLLVMGIGMGFTMPPLLLATQNAVSRDRLGVATSLNQFTRSIGGAVGVSLMGAIVAAATSGDAPTPAEITAGLHRAFVIGALLSAVAWAASLAIPPGKPGPRPVTMVVD